MFRTGLALAASLALISCAEEERILPGERLELREALQTQGGEAPLAVNVSRAATLPGMQANAGWTQSPVSPGVRTDHAALSLPLSPLWQSGIGGGDGKRQRLIADPVTDGTRIFTLSSDFQLTATSTGGQTLWSRAVVPLSETSAQAMGGGLALAGGRLFVTTGFGELRALNPADGSELWVQEVDNTASGAPSVVGDLVYLTAGDRTGWAVEASDGRVRWQLDGLGDSVNVAGAPAPAVSGDRVVFAFGDGTLQSTFREGGLTLWSATLAGGRPGRAMSAFDDVTGDPVIANGRVYAGTHTGRLVALDLYSGDRLWTLNSGALDRPWVAGGSVYAISDENTLLRVDAETGAQIWEVDLPGWVPRRKPQRQRDRSFANYGPVLAGGQVIVASSDGFIRSFDPASGALTGQTEIAGGATTAPIVAGGVLYVVSSRGVLHAYR
ncbi:outer membrane protein assembly factor BamB family protein [Litorisediminicola beolgyonensis]|uniref:PQQ-binding-like beta-propeller repeat protein n=1 Tax=Litorisediminicola beolgyonensis TaxID=1173614 RepID=A0ABW3ZH56_9RHOB